MIATNPQQDTITVTAPVQLPALTLPAYHDLVLQLQREHRAAAARIQRGANILTTPSAVWETTETGVYQVQCSGGGLYYRATSLTCTCPDHTQRGQTCKHAWAIVILHAASALVYASKVRQLPPSRPTRAAGGFLVRRISADEREGLMMMLSAPPAIVGAHPMPTRPSAA